MREYSCDESIQHENYPFGTCVKVFQKVIFPTPNISMKIQVFPYVRVLGDRICRFYRIFYVRTTWMISNMNFDIIFRKAIA